MRGAQTKTKSLLWNSILLCFTNYWGRKGKHECREQQKMTLYD